MMMGISLKKWNWFNTRQLERGEDSVPVIKIASKKNIIFKLITIFSLVFVVTYLLGNAANEKRTLFSNIAYGESSVTIPIEKNIEENNIDIIIPPTEVQTPSLIADTPPPISAAANEDINNSATSSAAIDENLTVQAVLGTKNQVVLASGIDAKITKFNLQSGDHFKKNQVLIEYDCTIDNGRLNEALSRQRVTEQQLAAYQKLAVLDSASNMEILIAQENNVQNKALITQIKGRLQSCKHIAPWNGRVMRKMASQYEYVQTGRVLMEISSLDPLRAEFLIPSRWLRWLNIGTPLNIFIGETNLNYNAKIVNIFGEVDPVSQSVQVVAEMEDYYEELLPGMSGRATFTRKTAENGFDKGFLGLKLLNHETE